MRILFVDQDGREAERLQKEFSRLRDWEFVSRQRGDAALEDLSGSQFDALVTAFELPDMPAERLLTEAHDTHPDVVRVVLSSTRTMERAVRAVPVSHQFLVKPANAIILRRVVERATRLQSLLTDPALRKLIGGIERLPALPKVFSALQRALAKPDVGAREVSDIVSCDAALCAKVLQMANSSFYAGIAAVSEIDQAVMRLGSDVIKALVMAVEVFDSCATSKVGLFDFDEFQQHSLRIATVAGRLLEDREMAADAYMAGMLHDIGKLIMAAKLPDRLETVLETSLSTGQKQHEVERELYGATHAEIGGYLMALWGLPYPIVEAVANHHAPARAPHQMEFGILGAVYIAECLLQQRDPDSEYMASIGAMDRLDALRDLAA